MKTPVNPEMTITLGSPGATGQGKTESDGGMNSIEHEMNGVERTMMMLASDPSLM